MNNTSSALKIVGTTYTKQPGNHHARRRPSIHIAQSADTAMKAAECAQSPAATMALARKSLRHEATTLRNAAQVILVSGLIAEAGICSLSGLAYEYLGKYFALSVLFVGFAVALISIAIAKVHYSVSNALLEEAKSLKMEG